MRTCAKVTTKWQEKEKFYHASVEVIFSNEGTRFQHHRRYVENVENAMGVSVLF